jgi:hypothetical protein
MHSPPADVVHFVRSHVRTIEELDVLIFCIDHRDRWWDAAAVAQRASLNASAAMRALDHFVRANLLDIRISDAVRYRFHPGTEDLTMLATAFAAAYHENPVAVVKLVARSAVSDSVRDFADAFRLKRDDTR